MREGKLFAANAAVNLYEELDTVTPGGRLGGPPSAKSLRAMLEVARTAADAAGVPDEAYEVDLAADARKVIDAFLDE